MVSLKMCCKSRIYGILEINRQAAGYRKHRRLTNGKYNLCRHGCP